LASLKGSEYVSNVLPPSLHARVSRVSQVLLDGSPGKQLRESFMHTLVNSVETSEVAFRAIFIHTNV
jgi:hypothetical protein